MLYQIVTLDNVALPRLYY